MKIKFIVLIFLFYSVAFSSAQNLNHADSLAKKKMQSIIPSQNKSLIVLTDSIIEHDKLLKTFRDACPKNWQIILNGDRMIIRSKDSIWLAYYNAAGRSVNDTTEKLFDDTSYIEQKGKRILPEASFRFEYLWTQEKMDDATKLNNKLYKEIKDLKVKYNLQNLREWHKWGESGSFGATPEEEERIKKYQEEKKNLESQRIKFPMYISDNYSIFAEYKNWQNDLVYMVSKIYPYESIKKIDYALELFLQVPEDK